MMKTSLVVFLVLLGFIFSNCTLKKRSYTRGYYVDWAFHKSTNNKPKTKVEVLSLKKEMPIEQASTNTELQKESESEIWVNHQATFSIKTKAIYKLDEPCSDLLTLRNGDEINVKIIELTDNLVKYKRCDNIDGPLISISKSKVFSIEYKNGTKEVFKESEVAPPTNAQKNIVIDESKLRMHPLSVVAFILSLLGIVFVPFSIIALILGSYAIKKINKNPTVYKGEYLARVAKIIAGVIIAIWAFIIFLAIIVALLA